MKKAMIAAIMAVVIGFVGALGLCVRVLTGAQAVAMFADGGMRIVLDAGHGGIDVGVTGKTTKVKESELNLAIVMQLKEKLTDMGFTVTLTRKTDAGLYGAATKGFKKRDMQRRKEIIEETNPLLVISVHQNFYPSSAYRGAQVFYSKNNANSERLALATQTQLNDLYAETGAKHRQALEAEYYILQCSTYPTVIVECGFLSNAKDEELLQTIGWQRRLSEGIAAGIMTYLSNVTA